MVVEEIKRNLIEKAQKKFRNIKPCGPYEDFSNSFTKEEDDLIFWFNVEDTQSTHILIHNE
jgi:hypothetical protein